jgi:flagellar hook-length control protein FliK
MAASQSKPDANKADETSPFALLVGQTQAKPATQQKDTQGKDSSNDKQGDASTASQAGNTNASTQTAAQAAAAQAAAKPVKAGKGDDKKKDDDSSDTPDGSAAAAALQQAGAQPPPPAQVALTAANAAITTTNDDASDDEPGVTAAGAAGVAASGQAKTQAAQNFQNAQAADQAAPADQADGQTNSQANSQTNSPASGQTSGPSGSAQAQAAAATQNLAQQSAAQQDAAQQGAIQPDGVQAPAKPWQAKTQNAGATGNAKTDSSQASAAKTADAKRAATPQPQAVAANDLPVIKPADATNNAMTGVAGSQPQTQQTQGSDAPSVTQNVQISTPTPNMPALAVEIAAKSQSGAKQFDIRLDPPELGRVEVRLSIDATGKASAHLSADQPQTLDLLQKDAPTLTRALRDAGLDVSQDGLNFSLRQQPGDAGTGNQSRGGNGRSFTLAATTSIDATSASAAYRAPADGRLDIRV